MHSFLDYLFYFLVLFSCDHKIIAICGGTPKTKIIQGITGVYILKSINIVPKIDQTKRDTIRKISDLRPQIQLKIKNTMSEIGTATINASQGLLSQEYKLPYTNNEVATSQTRETASRVMISLLALEALLFLYHLSMLSSGFSAKR